MPVIGIDMTDGEPVNGWEAVKPNHFKPDYLIEAEAAEEKAAHLYNVICEDYPTTGNESDISLWHNKVLSAWQYYFRMEMARREAWAVWNAEKALALGESVAISLPQLCDILK